MNKKLITEFTRKNFSKPDDRTELPKCVIDTINLGNFNVSRLTCEPGWRWSETLPSIIGTDTCQFEHPFWMVISGRFAVQMDDDGRVEVYGPGDIGMIPSGHDAWVEGEEPVVAIDMQVLSGKK